MTKRINWIDWSKAIGIFLVVLGHGRYTPELMPFKTYIYSFHMPFFFIISGYLHKDISSFKEYLQKNIRTLAIPYIMLSLLACAYFIPYAISREIFDVRKIISGFLTGGIQGPASSCWFIYCLFIVKIFAFVLLKTPKLMHAILLFLSFIIVYYGLFAFDFRIDAAFIAISFFAFGYYLHKHNVLNTINSRLLLFSLLVGLAIIFSITSQKNGPVDMYLILFGKSVYLYYLNAILGSFILILFCKLLDHISLKFVTVISSGTMLILALHMTEPINGVLQSYLHFPNSLIMPINVLISIANLFLLYYPIRWIQKYANFILGGR